MAVLGVDTVASLSGECKTRRFRSHILLIGRHTVSWFTVRHMLFCAGIDAQDDPVAIQKKESLVHVVCQRGKLFLLSMQFLDLVVDRQPLLLDPGHKRGKLGIGMDRLRMVQIHVIDRFDDCLRGAECQGTGKSNHKDQHPEHGRHSLECVSGCVHGKRETNHRVIVHLLGVVIREFSALRRIPGCTANAGLVRCLDFRPGKLG